MAEKRWRHRMKPVGRIVEQELILVVVYKESESGEKEILQKAIFEEEDSANMFVDMVNQLKGDDVKIATSKDTIKMIEEA